MSIKSLKKRYRVPYNMFNDNPKATILSLMGPNVNIIKYKSSDAILNDDTVIVDVEYEQNNLSLTKVYFINVANVKEVSQDGNEYSIIIDGHHVIISLPNDAQAVLPIRMYAYNDAKGSINFNYRGKIIKDPMNSLFSVLLSINKFKIDPVEKLYDDKFKLPDKVKIENSLVEMRYKYAANKLPLLDSITKFNTITKQEELKNNGEGYIIDWKELIKGKDYLNGMILVQPIRNPYTVLFVHSYIFTIDKQLINTITDFLDQDYNNFMNYHYKMEKNAKK